MDAAAGGELPIRSGAPAPAACLDVGGIEYLVNDRTGEIAYYYINALSNFVTDAVNFVGFDPAARFADYLEQRLFAGESAAARYPG